MSVPKKIHFIWLGSPLPFKYQKFIDSWSYYNPSYEIKIWNDSAVKSHTWKCQHILNATKNYGVISDVLRYEILYNEGGIYVDTDFLCIKSFDTLIENYSFIAGITGNNGFYVMNALLGAKSGHPILEILIQGLELYKGNDPMQVFSTTGPSYLTKTLDQNRDVWEAEGKVFPPEFFYPVPSEFSKTQDFPWKEMVTKNSYAVHFWEFSWEHKSIFEKLRKVLLKPFPSALKTKIKNFISRLRKANER